MKDQGIFNARRVATLMSPPASSNYAPQHHPHCTAYKGTGAQNSRGEPTRLTSQHPWVFLSHSSVDNRRSGTSVNVFCHLDHRNTLFNSSYRYYADFLIGPTGGRIRRQIPAQRRRLTSGLLSKRRSEGSGHSVVWVAGEGGRRAAGFIIKSEQSELKEQATYSLVTLSVKNSFFFLCRSWKPLRGGGVKVETAVWTSDTDWNGDMRP